MTLNPQTPDLTITQLWFDAVVATAGTPAAVGGIAACGVVGLKHLLFGASRHKRKEEREALALLARYRLKNAASEQYDPVDHERLETIIVEYELGLRDDLPEELSKLRE